MMNLFEKVKQKIKLYIGLTKKLLVSYFWKEFKEMVIQIMEGGIENFGIFLISLPLYLYLKIEWCGLIMMLDVICFGFFFFIGLVIYTFVIKVKNNKDNEIS